MPLDIQPLTPGRRAAMLLVLLGLFGASLGFAQWLVMSRTARYYVSIAAPAGMTDDVPAYKSLNGVVLTGSGAIEGQPRRFAAFSYPGTMGPDRESIQDEATSLYELVGGIRHDQDVPVRAAPGQVGPYGGIHLEGVIGEGEAKQFLMLRLTEVPGRVVAICYSGPGNFTDADKELFEAFCTAGVTITPAAAGRDK